MLWPGVSWAAATPTKGSHLPTQVNNVNLVGKSLPDAESVIRAATKGQSVQLEVERRHVIENFTIAVSEKGQALGLDIGRVCSVRSRSFTSRLLLPGSCNAAVVYCRCFNL